MFTFLDYNCPVERESIVLYAFTRILISEPPKDIAYAWPSNIIEIHL